MKLTNQITHVITGIRGTSDCLYTLYLQINASLTMVNWLQVYIISCRINTTQFVRIQCALRIYCSPCMYPSPQILFNPAWTCVFHLYSMCVWRSWMEKSNHPFYLQFIWYIRYIWYNLLSFKLLLSKENNWYILLFKCRYFLLLLYSTVLLKKINTV